MSADEFIAQAEQSQAHGYQDRPRRGRHQVRSLDRTAATRRVSLALPPELPIEEWVHVGRQIAVIADSSAWWLGDWLLYGECSYPDRYRRAIEETSLNPQTLRNYAWVERKVPPSRLLDKLSVQHHMEGGPL